MHTHLEIIMPPTYEVDSQVSRIMAPFDDNKTDDEGAMPQNAFWDFWVIGGRWSGCKLEASIGEDQIKKFREELVRRKVTVSGLTAGKQTLEPASQVPMVDALWCEFFPNSGVSVCPLFSHSNNQYDSGSTISGDICRVVDLPKSLECAHVIIAKHGWRNEAEFEAGEMLQTSIWNGVTFQDTQFDGRVSSAIEWHEARINKMYNQEFIDKNSISDDWMCVTVDYHS